MFPISEKVPAVHVGPLPKAVDVAVIGGGVAGVATGLFLARSGVSVAIFEKGRIAGEQSSRNWGWIRQQGRDPAELPVMIEANRLWRELDAEAGGAAGVRQTGILYLAAGPKEMARNERWMDHARAHRLDTRLLTAAEVAAQLPGARGRWAGGMVTPSDLRGEPWAAVPALARLAAASGAVVREGCAVRALDLAAGRVAGVVTEAGLVRCSAAVVAGGAWSSLFLRAHGIDIPQLSVRATVVATGPVREVHDGAAVDEALAWRRRLDCGYTLAPGGFHELFLGPDAFRRFGAFWPQIKADPLGHRLLPAVPRGYPDGWTTPRRWDPDRPSPFEAVRVLDPSPNRAKVRWLPRAFAERFPEVGPVPVAAAWAGMIDTMPDVVPVLDAAAAIPGLWIATGLSGHGFGIGPGVGRVMADLVQGKAPGHDLTRFRLSRFSDGSRLELGPAL